MTEVLSDQSHKPLLIGFSKKAEHNLDILVGLSNIRARIARKSLGVSHAPMLFGPSRKKFLGHICSRIATDERDPATITCVIASVLGGANIVRDLSYVLYEALLCLCGNHLYP